MTQFTVRVEIPRAKGQDYQAIDNEMEINGFLRFVDALGNQRVTLPSGEYNYISNATTHTSTPSVEAVADSVRRIVKGVVKDNVLLADVEPKILVTESAARFASGLDSYSI